VSNDDPSARHGEALGVDRAEVVRVRVVGAPQGPDRGHLVAIVVRQRRHGLTGARHLGTQSLAHCPERSAGLPHARDATPLTAERLAAAA